MLIGNPDKFAFLFEPVPEWCSECFVNGLLYIYVNGRQFPETLRTTTLSDDIFYLIDSPAFSKPQINAPLFLLEKRELFINLYKVTFPEDGTENDYSYLLPLDELQSAGYCFFAIASRACLKIVNTPKRRLFFRHTLPIFLAIHPVFLRQIGFVWRKNSSPLSILPFFKQGLTMKYASWQVIT